MRLTRLFLSYLITDDQHPGFARAPKVTSVPGPQASSPRERKYSASLAGKAPVTPGGPDFRRELSYIIRLPCNTMLSQIFSLSRVHVRFVRC